MKKLLLILLSFAILLLSNMSTFAQSINDEECIDLESVYTEINNSSYAVTGVRNSIDAIKKVNTVASLMNIVSIFVGDQIYCVKNEEVALQSSTLKSTGLLGMVNEANAGIYSLFPDIDVTNHLAEMFIPGYDNKNSLMAQTIDFGATPDQQTTTNSTTNKITDFVEGGIETGTQEALQNIDVKEYQVVEANATGMNGYDYLKDVVHLDALWKVSSGLVYVLFVIIFIVVGFMIMFRKNLPGDVTVTVSRALPKLIMSLILVTFSFAIVGIIMDFGRTGISVSRYIFNSAYSSMNVANPDIIEIKNVWSLADDVFKKTRLNTGPGDAISSIPMVGPTLAKVLLGTGNGIGGELVRVGAMGVAYYFLDKTLPHIINEANISTDLEITVSFLGSGVTADILQPIVDMVIWTIKNAVHIAVTGVKIALIASIVKSLILIIISFYAAIRVFITLFTTYLKLFLNVILGPFQIMMGAVPGNSHFMTNWFKSVVANTLVFVAIYVVINTFNLISKSVDPTKFNFFGNSGTIWPDILISLESVIVIAGYLFAANLPKIINGALGLEENRNVITATADVKESAKKIPLVGGLFS